MAFGCWDRFKNVVFIESVTNLYYSSVENKVIRV